MSECPICFDVFPGSVIQAHASSCCGPNPKGASAGTSAVSRKTSHSSPASTKRPAQDSPASKKRPVEDPPVSSGSDYVVLKRAKTGGTSPGPTPLADRMRPKSMTDLAGHEDLFHEDSIWMKLIESGRIPSMILWGPPGCGKSSLANIIATKCRSEGSTQKFVCLSACTASVSDVKDVISRAKNDRAMMGRHTVLFMDEIHRFNKAQQDAFLPHVENGTVTLIGATTENPSFSLNSALLSRCKVMPLQKLPPAAVRHILDKAVQHLDLKIVENDVTDLSAAGIGITDEGLAYLSTICDGDARTALNSLDIAVQSATCGKVIGIQCLKSGLVRTHVNYDRTGDEHYHCASALQKSIRGSNANAALYWTMRMLEGGEDPMFIARRMVRMASEDVGLGDSSALGLAVATMQGCQLIGRPECNVLLAHCAVYLARAKKSHEVYHAMQKAIETIRDNKTGLAPVPIHLRNATSSLDRKMGYGAGYTYDLSKNQNLEYLPPELKHMDFFKD